MEKSQIKEKIRMWLLLLIISAIFFMYVKFNDFDELKNGGWWMISFNIAILVLLFTIKNKIKVSNKKEMNNLKKLINDSINKEKKFNFADKLKDKEEECWERYGLYEVYDKRIKFSFGKLILLSILFSIFYILLFFICKPQIGVYYDNFALVNLLLLIFFFSSLYCFLCLIIELIFLFEFTKF